MSKFSQKFRLYIKHCSICELNQTKKHVSYEKLIFIKISIISFRTITMNFILTLSEEFDVMLIVTFKTGKRVNLIFDKII